VYPFDYAQGKLRFSVHGSESAETSPRTVNGTTWSSRPFTAKLKEAVLSLLLGAASFMSEKGLVFAHRFGYI